MKTLIIVDMQVDFISGSLANVEAQKIIPNMKNFIKEFEGDIICTRDTHYSNYLETNEGKHLPVEHCIEGSDGWQIWPGLEADGAIFIDKPSFGYMDWSSYNLEEVEIIGLCTDICVVSNAI